MLINVVRVIDPLKFDKGFLQYCYLLPTHTHISCKIVNENIITAAQQLLHKLKEMFIRSRTGDYNFELDRIHLVGHSLGSHIMAFASQKLIELQRHDMKDWVIERITALDPAQPCFRDFTDPILRLTIDDAPFIDVIHTNARQILHLGLGLPEQLGHMDFYPNGGQVMIGCSDINVKIWSFLMLPVNR
uniref:phospholipase A1 n=1 Tax=Trichogramma kaykai TaxID=54128 RepID=A0ABD2W9B8_9HYME